MNRTISEIIKTYDRKSAAPLPENEWRLVLSRANQLCAEQLIDPAKIYFLDGPDEWVVGIDRLPVSSDELIELLSIINCEATGIHPLCEQRGTSRKGATMTTLEEAEKQTNKIGEDVIKATFALKKLRESAADLAQRAGDLLIDAKDEQRKINLVTGLRGMVESIDEVLG